MTVHDEDAVALEAHALVEVLGEAALGVGHALELVVAALVRDPDARRVEGADRSLELLVARVEALVELDDHRLVDGAVLGEAAHERDGCGRARGSTLVSSRSSTTLKRSPSEEGTHRRRACPP